jgi:hypothetical protein
MMSHSKLLNHWKVANLTEGQIIRNNLLHDLLIAIGNGMRKVYQV